MSNLGAAPRQAVRPLLAASMMMVVQVIVGCGGGDVSSGSQPDGFEVGATIDLTCEREARGETGVDPANNMTFPAAACGVSGYDKVTVHTDVSKMSIFMIPRAATQVELSGTVEESYEQDSGELYVVASESVEFTPAAG